MSQIQKLTVKGYKSIRSLEDFELRPLNVLIGANGAGKSNFIGLFRFLASVVGDNFPVDVQKWGGPEALLHYGSKVTPQPEDVVVVQRENDASVFKRLDAEELADWLTDDYSLGELWKRNVLGGRPTR